MAVGCGRLAPVFVLPLLLFFAVCAGHGRAGEYTVPEGWIDSLPQALKRAGEEEKFVMAFFTGSDWCGPCMTLKDEVFSSADFKLWAEANVVRLYLDFPKQTELPAQIAQQNQALLGKLGVEAFPTVVFLDAQGTALTALGYMPGGTEKWISYARMLLPKRTEKISELTQAYRVALRDQKPLLVLASLGAATAAQSSTLQALTSQPELRRNSCDNIAVCELDLARAGTEDLGIWRHISQKAGVGGAYPAVVLLDNELTPLFSAQGTDFSPVEAAKQIADKLIKPGYDGKWLHSLPEGFRVARALDRPLLLFFTGSDWCGPCMQIHNEIFLHKDFTDYARDNLVLVEFDFPRMKKQDEETVFQNQLIQQTFGIEGYPTVVLLDNLGNPVGALGYDGSSPTEFVNTVRSALSAYFAKK